MYRGPAPWGSGAGAPRQPFVGGAAAVAWAPSCAAGLVSECVLSTEILAEPVRSRLTLSTVALVSAPSLCWIATAPFISFDGEKGVKLEMKRVAAFVEVDDDAGSLFDYDVDRVRARFPCFAAASFGKDAVPLAGWRLCVQACHAASRLAAVLALCLTQLTADVGVVLVRCGSPRLLVLGMA